MRKSDIPARSILLVEDEAIQAMLSMQALEKYGYSISTVNTGEKAVALIDAGSDIDLILMDIDLGKGLDGTQAAAGILSRHDIPIVFLSSHTEPEVVEKTEKITSYGYVVKNSSITVLDASIKMAFKLFEAQKNIKGQKNDLEKANEKLLISNQMLLATKNDLIASESKIQNKLKSLLDPEGYADAIELSDIIDSPALQSLLEDFYDLTGILGAILDINGKILVAAGWQDICTKFHRCNPDTAKNCMESDNILTKGVPVGTFKTYQCKNNMRDMVTPLVIDNKHVGNVFLGQFIYDDEIQNLDLFRNQAQKYGFDEVKYIEALQKVPRISREKANTAMKFYSKLSGMISSLSYSSIKIARSVAALENSEMALQAKNEEYEVLNEELRSTVEELQNTSEELQEASQKLQAQNGTLTATMYYYQTLLEKATDGIVLLDSNGNFKYVSNPAKLMFGYDLDDDITGNPSVYTHPDDVDLVISNLMNLLGDPSFSPILQYRFQTKSGEWKWVESIFTNLLADANIESIVLNFRDISDQKLAEQKVQALLSEKELILKEVHHRIKNNMNSIYGLLLLQAGTLKDASAIRALDDAANRVQSMQLLYDKLYRSTRYDELAVNDYFPQLVDEIVSNFPNGKTVSVKKNIEDFSIDAKKLQPVGIIINELITNIMKYAFTGRADGIISISATLKENRVCISIADNGAGMSESVSFEHSTGFGLVLVQALTQQLAGTIRIERGQGTKIVLEFEK